MPEPCQRQGRGGPRPFYERLGFVPTGRLVDGLERLPGRLVRGRAQQRHHAAHEGQPPGGLGVRGEDEDRREDDCGVSGW